MKRSWREKLADNKGLPKVCEVRGRMTRRWGTGRMVIPAPLEVDALMKQVPKGIDQIMEIMTRGRFRHVPVVRHGELLGVISIGDVVKARLEETRHETEALKAYIVAG